MAIIPIEGEFYTEDWKARKSSESLQSGQTATRVFTVRSDTHDEIESVIYDAIPVVLGDTFPGTFACYCTERSADRITDDRTVWTVTCSYTSILNQSQVDRITMPNPLDRRTRISWSSRTVMRAVTQCQGSGFYQMYSQIIADSFVIGSGVTSRPNIVSVANSATDGFDPPLECPLTEWVMTCTKNVADVPAWFKTYDNSVNDADQMIEGQTYTKGTLKLEGIRFSEKMKENGIDYRQLSWNVIVAKPRDLRKGGQYTSPTTGSITVADEEIVPEPWDIEVLDEGMRTYSNNKWNNIQTGDPRESVNKPVPLNGHGTPIDVSEAKIAEFALTWRLFRPYPRKPFNILPWV